jgi:hypothetical protein
MHPHANRSVLNALKSPISPSRKKMHFAKKEKRPTLPNRRHEEERMIAEGRKRKRERDRERERERERKHAMNSSSGNHKVILDGFLSQFTKERHDFFFQLQISKVLFGVARNPPGRWKRQIITASTATETSGNANSTTGLTFVFIFVLFG